MIRTASAASALALLCLRSAHAQSAPVPMPATAMVTFAPASTEMAYFLRVTTSDGAVAECYTPCNLTLPAGSTRVEVLSPRGFSRTVNLSGRPTLVKISHLSKWRYGVGGLLLGISLAEFIYGAVYFPWNGGGDPRDAAIAAVAWAFGGLELTSATTLLALGGRNRLQVIDNPMQLKAEIQSRSAVRLAGIGASISPLGSGLSVAFRF